MQAELKVLKFIKFIKSKVSDFWEQNDAKVVFLAGLVLVAAISFEFGLMQGQNGQIKPLIIEKTAPQEASKEEAVNLTIADPKAPQGANLAVKKDCAFVGSKNSNKYHLPTCQWAKRIKPENVICFKTAEEAAAKNYLPDKGCIK